MTIAELLRDFLLDLGFHQWQIVHRQRHATNLDEIRVYLGRGKLSFLINNFNVDCVLLNGGMSTPWNEEYTIENIAYPWLDLRDPTSFDSLKNKLVRFLPAGVKHESL